MSSSPTMSRVKSLKALLTGFKALSRMSSSPTLVSKWGAYAIHLFQSAVAHELFSDSVVKVHRTPHSIRAVAHMTNLLSRHTPRTTPDNRAFFTVFCLGASPLMTS